MNLLVVEDDLFKFSKIEVLIKTEFESYAITRFDNVHDSIVYLKDNNPDKIILDMSLPGHAGIRRRKSSFYACWRD